MELWNGLDGLFGLYWLLPFVILIKWPAVMYITDRPWMGALVPSILASLAGFLAHVVGTILLLLAYLFVPIFTISFFGMMGEDVSGPVWRGVEHAFNILYPLLVVFFPPVFELMALKFRCGTEPTLRNYIPLTAIQVGVVFMIAAAVSLQ